MNLRTGSRTAAALVAALTLASACGGGNGEEPPSSVSLLPDIVTSTTAGGAVVTTTTIEEYNGPVGPLTGAPIAVERVESPSLVIKIGNNDGKSRPQTGLLEADLVYEELVEGLKTRFFAVFQSSVPETIGPVRSGRSSDIELLAGLSTPMFGYSGGNATVLSELRKARERGVFIDVGALRLDNVYYRSEDREIPDNLYITPGDIPDTSAGVPLPLFSYGTPPSDSGVPVGGVEVVYPTTFGRESAHLWDARLGGWVRIQDGTLQTSVVDGAEVEVAPANVVVATIIYGTSAADNKSPQAETFGDGPVRVFTRGRMIEGSWARSAAEPRWMLTDADGNEVALAPGPTWVLLAAGEGSRFATAEIKVIDPTDAAKLLSDARESAGS